ncbi:MAG: choice-of-anchor B family protein, partial [Gemmatimonadota bacterium]|nr:choice-of-anchor B family protein [Gemmatimonadota bacterium]
MRRLRMTMLAGSLALAAMPLQAQDRSGAGVAVTNDDAVLVLKPGFGRGPASLLVFERAEGRWTSTERLWSEGSTRGESFGTSLALLGDGVLVASGDPGLRYGAWAFARAASGWTAAAPLALDRTAAAGGGPVTLATVMSILQPPARAVAADGDRALIATAGGEGGPAVRVFERSTEGTWRSSATLEPEGLERNAGWGSAVALRGARALVGAPGQGRAGAVFVFERGDDGSWRQAAVLEDPDGGSDGLGSSLAFLSDDQVAVGAPRAERSRGAVAGFVRSGEGTWSRAWRLEPAGGGGVRGFGGALAARGDELWVGAPGSDDGAGRAYGYVRPGPGSAWEATEAFAPDDREPRDGFGSALGLGPGVGVIGSPGSAGGAGAAFVYERVADGWSGPTRLRAAGELEPITGAEVRCEDDAAAGYDCSEVDLLAYLPLSAIGGGPDERVSDNWGWTDPLTGREYALIGRTGGAAILDVTEPTDPSYRGVIPANPSGARDLKVYDDHLFFTGDGAGAHGLVVFDLTRLRDV